jgi:hypothetical protein
MLLLSSVDPAAGARLRGIINKYKVLAKSAPTFGPVAQLKSDLDRMIDKARHDAIDLCVIADLLEDSARALRALGHVTDLRQRREIIEMATP